MTKYHRHKLRSGKEYHHPITRKHKVERKTAYHKHTLPTGKTYWHSRGVTHRVIRKIKEKVVPKRLRKAIYRVTLGKSYFAITEKKGTPAPFLTIYVWVYTRNPENYSETSFKNEIERIKQNLFIDWGTRAKEHWEDNVETDYSYNLGDSGIDEGSFTGLEIHRLDQDEVLNELDIIYKSAIFYSEGGSLKEEYKF